MSYYYPKQVRAGTPDEIIDMHGYTTREARGVLHDLLETARGTHVRLIVGKGKNGTDGPVLRTSVEHALREHDIRYAYAHPLDGGDGALDVYF